MDRLLTFFSSDWSTNWRWSSSLFLQFSNSTTSILIMVAVASSKPLHYQSWDEGHANFCYHLLPESSINLSQCWIIHLQTKLHLRARKGLTSRAALGEWSTVHYWCDWKVSPTPSCCHGSTGLFGKRSQHRLHVGLEIEVFFVFLYRFLPVDKIGSSSISDECVCTLILM